MWQQKSVKIINKKKQKTGEMHDAHIFICCRFSFLISDMVCEMDLLRTQNIRRLTNLYRRLSTPMVKGERIKFLSHLHELLNTESNVPVVKEVHCIAPIFFVYFLFDVNDYDNKFNIYGCLIENYPCAVCMCPTNI